MLYNEPHPLETKVLSRRFGLENSASIATYLATEGYQAFEKAAGMKPEQIIEEMKISNLRGRGGAGFPAGMKRSEEHTSELQSLRHLVCRLLLEKKVFSWTWVDKFLVDLAIAVVFSFRCLV